MKAISIHQPNYIPWLGYFYKISQSDCFIFLDDAQFSNEGMHNFNYIMTHKGPLRLKIPVRQTLGDKINEVYTKDELGWKEKHLSIIEANYKKTKYFDEIYSDLKGVFFKEYISLAEFNAEVIRIICDKFGIMVEFQFASKLGITTRKEEKVLDICSALNADIYYSGTGARVYQKEDSFTKRGIDIRYSEFKSFFYEQIWNGSGKIVSVVDYLMNCGYDWGRVSEYQKKEHNGNG